MDAWETAAKGRCSRATASRDRRGGKKGGVIGMSRAPGGQRALLKVWRGVAVPLILQRPVVAAQLARGKQLQLTRLLAAWEQQRSGLGL